MEAEQNPVPIFRFTCSTGRIDGRAVVIYKIYRNNILIRTRVDYLDELESEEAGREE
jgi:hypothetical protein